MKNISYFRKKRLHSKWLEQMKALRAFEVIHHMRYPDISMTATPRSLATRAISVPRPSGSTVSTRTFRVRITLGSVPDDSMASAQDP